MDSLDEQEIESIWKRSKEYIEIKNIKSITKEGIQEEIKQQLEKAPRGKNKQANSEFLIKKGFHKQATENPNIRRELLADNIRVIKVRGQKRFQVAKGTPTTKINGKTIRAGQFLSGKDEEEAIKNLKKKADK